MITSLQNEQVKHVISLHKKKGREEWSQFLIEGRRFVQDALMRQAPVAKVFLCPDQLGPEEDGLLEGIKEKGIPVVWVDWKVMDRMSATEEAQGILAIVDKTEISWEDWAGTGEQGCWLIVDGVQDPGNLGTMMRTALAAGVTQVVMSKGTVDIYNPKVLRATMGTFFSMKVLTDQEPEEILHYCSRYDIKPVTADMGGISLYEKEVEFWHLPLALIVGNEGNGPCALFRGQRIEKISIPMANQVESLNVGMAAGIILYERFRRNSLVQADGD